MERIEDVMRGPVVQDRFVGPIPALPCPMYGVRFRLADAWAVLTGRATAVQWPHQRWSNTNDATRGAVDGE